MTLRIKGAWILAGLAAVGSAFVGEREARANPTSPAAIGIQGKSGMVTGSDPFYYYDFQVTLNAGYIWNPGDFITIDSGAGLAGVTPVNPPGPNNNSNLPTPGSTSFQPSGFGSPVITLLSDTAPYASSVEWENPTNGSPIYGGVNGYYVGDFIILTSVSVPAPVESITFDSAMHDSSDNPVTQTGVSVDVSLVVPEPSSVILLLTGATALPLLIVTERRRKSSRRSNAV
jgi:hypothetical protein